MEKWTVKIFPGNRTHEVEGKKTAGRLVEELGLNPETVLVVRGGEMVTREEVLGPGDDVTVIQAISGG